MFFRGVFLFVRVVPVSAGHGDLEDGQGVAVFVGSDEERLARRRVFRGDDRSRLRGDVVFVRVRVRLRAKAGVEWCGR